MPLDSEGRGELRPPMDRKQGKGVVSSRRFTIACIVILLLVAGLAGWGGLRTWHYLYGSSELNLDGSYQDMLASLSLTERQLLEGNDIIEEDWREYEEGRSSKALLRRTVLEAVYYLQESPLPGVRIPDAGLLRGSEPGWQELPPLSGVSDRVKLLQPGQFDDDPEEELFVIAGFASILELDGSTRRLEALDPARIRLNCAWDYDGDGRDELLRFSGLHEEKYSYPLAVVNLQGEQLRDCGIYFGGYIHSFGDFNGDGLLDLFIRAGQAEGDSTEKYMLLTGGGNELLQDCRQHPVNLLAADLDGNGLDELVGYPYEDRQEQNLATSYELGRGEREYPLLPSRTEGGKLVWAGDLDGDGHDELLYDWINVIVEPDSGMRHPLELPAGHLHIWFHDYIEERLALLEIDGQRYVVANCESSGYISSCFLGIWTGEGRLVHWESLGEDVSNLFVVNDHSGQRIVLEMGNRILISQPGWTPE